MYNPRLQSEDRSDRNWVLKRYFIEREEAKNASSEYGRVRITQLIGETHQIT